MAQRWVAERCDQEPMAGGIRPLRIGGRRFARLHQRLRADQLVGVVHLGGQAVGAQPLHQRQRFCCGIIRPVVAVSNAACPPTLESAAEGLVGKGPEGGLRAG